MLLERERQIWGGIPEEECGEGRRGRESEKESAKEAGEKKKRGGRSKRTREGGNCVERRGRQERYRESLSEQVHACLNVHARQAAADPKDLPHLRKDATQSQRIPPLPARPNCTPRSPMGPPSSAQSISGLGILVSDDVCKHAAPPSPLCNLILHPSPFLNCCLRPSPSHVCRSRALSLPLSLDPTYLFLFLTNTQPRRAK